jgi:hypothetical protein
VTDQLQDTKDNEATIIDLTGVAFAKRLANLLTISRQQSGLTRRALARQSRGAFTARDLKAAEEAKRLFGPTAVGELVVLYGVDLGMILPKRLPLEVDPKGVVRTGGIEIDFIPGDTDSLLTSYLRLVRALRHQQRARLIDLRRDDIETLAGYLDVPGPAVMDWLSSLMGSTRVQRESMGSLFAAGARVVGLTNGAAATVPVSIDNPTRP